MKNKLIRYWVIVCSVLTTLYCALAILFLVLIRQANRQRNNAIIRTWALHLLKIIKLDYKIYNPYNVDFTAAKNIIVMSNHSSLYDIPLSFAAVPGTLRMLAKKELARIPIFGLVMKKAEFIFVDRGDHTRAISDLARAKEKMESGVMLWIAPEGTRSANGQLLPFKKGGFMIALETGATIVPMGIRGAHRIVEKNTVQVHRHQIVEVHIGKPIDASRYTLATRAELMAEVENAIQVAAGLRVPS